MRLSPHLGAHSERSRIRQPGGQGMFSLPAGIPIPSKYCHPWVHPVTDSKTTKARCILLPMKKFAVEKLHYTHTLEPKARGSSPCKPTPQTITSLLRSLCTSFLFLLSWKQTLRPCAIPRPLGPGLGSGQAHVLVA